MKAESRQIPQKLAARLKFVCCLVKFCHKLTVVGSGTKTCWQCLFCLMRQSTAVAILPLAEHDGSSGHMTSAERMTY